MVMPVATVSKDSLSEFADMKPGTIVSPTYTDEWVRQNLLGGK